MKIKKDSLSYLKKYQSKNIYKTISLPITLCNTMKHLEHEHGIKASKLIQIALEEFFKKNKID